MRRGPLISYVATVSGAGGIFNWRIFYSTRMPQITHRTFFDMFILILCL